MVITFNGMKVEIIRSNRKTVALEIKEAGIFVRAPYRMSEEEIREFLSERNEWIVKHLAILEERLAQRKQLGFFSLEEIEALGEKAVEVIPKKVEHYASIIGVDYRRITIRNQRTRWGSCSSNGNLNFNCLLMLFPDEVIDSVVVHELCHRKHMDHSAEFYAEVERAFPNYKKCQKWLKENGGQYLSRMP